MKDEKWLKASVPGTVHTDLMTHKIIPDPFLDENEKKVQWIENEDWEYRSHFTITNKEWSNLNKVLIFEGLDAFSEIHING